MSYEPWDDDGGREAMADEATAAARDPHEPMNPQPESRWRVWPRTKAGHCSCPTCTAIREGRLDRGPDQGSEWRRRMGGTPG